MFTDEEDNSTIYIYDLRNRLQIIRDALIQETEFSYDLVGNLAETLDAGENSTIFDYDSRNRLLRTVDPYNGVTKFDYDAAGNLRWSRDQLGHRIINRYDSRGRMLRTKNAEGGVTLFSYDASGNLIRLTDPIWNTSRFTFDGRDRLVRETDAINQSLNLEYDAADNLVQRVDREGRKTTFEYDDLDQLWRERWFDAEDEIVNEILYSYDDVGNLELIRDNSSTIAYTYDARDRAISVDNTDLNAPNAPSVVLEYAYDGVGNTVSVNDTINGVAGAITSYDYDKLNRTMKIIHAGATTTSEVDEKRVDLFYNELGQFDTIQRYAGVDDVNPITVSTYGYDKLNRLKSLYHANPAFANERLASYEYAYDRSSQLREVRDVDGTKTYIHDKTGQLMSVSHANPIATDESYSYDKAGNRESSYLHDDYLVEASNRLSSDGYYRYSYDNEGNVTRRTEVLTGDYRIFAWDHRNRLRRVTDFESNDTTDESDDTQVKFVEFVYDGFDRRIKKSIGIDSSNTDDVTHTHFIYDREDVIAEFVAMGTDGALTNRYLHGPAVDQIFAQQHGSNSLWYLADHVGSVRDLTDSAGNVTDHLVYDSFGNLMNTSDVSFALRYQFTGREFDAELGVYYNRARYYDPSLGRFMSEDPIGLASLDSNAYRYAFNSPLTYTDPSGNNALLVALAVAGAYWIEQAVFDPTPIGDPEPSVGQLTGGFVTDRLGGKVFDKAQDVCKILRKTSRKATKKLPALDETGKVHGELPRPQDLGKYPSDDLRKLQDELKQSVAERINKNAELGYDPAHGQRQAAEQQLIKSIEKYLGD